ncbi:MAG: DUF3772 domain-containing protein [Pikeienuella sp.]
MTHSLRHVLVALLVFIALPFGAVAADDDWERWDREAATARSAIEANEASTSALSRMRQRLTAQREDAKALSVQAVEKIDRLQKELKALGEAPESGEAPEIAALRLQLTDEIVAATAQQGRALQVSTRADLLLDDLTTLSQRRFVNRLETRGTSPLSPSVWRDAGAAVSLTIDKVGDEARLATYSETGKKLLRERLPLTGLAFLGALFVLFGLRGAVVGLFVSGADKETRKSRRLAFGVGAAAVRLLTAAVGAGLILWGVGSMGLLGVVGEAVLSGFAWILIYLILGYTLCAALFSPDASHLRLSSVSDANARGAFRAGIAGAAALAADTFFTKTQAALNVSSEAQVAFSFLTVSLGALALWRLSVRLQRIDEAAATGSIAAQVGRLIRRIALAVAVLSPILSIAGFDFAARILVFPTLTSLAIIAIGHLAFVLIREVVEVNLVEDTGRSQRLRLIPVIAAFLLFCGTLPLLALAWGADQSDLQAAYSAIAAGLVVGEIAISPVDFITFVLVFGIGYTITRSAQKVMRGTVLPKTNITDGGASALSAGLGYLGVFLSAIAAISATGIDLSSLAIVAGALSVGVGFGLQTIVSNFVSGIILLIERPIKIGDWIEVGGASGYVKQVNVRSTEIETFDRASYIIPNTDLIAGAVLNWTHSNKTGRVRAPVGVAYGTDPRRVEAILLEIAAEHKMVLSSPAPSAYFMRFGADALEFELRVYLRDVNWMLTVTSDLNFAIAERFEKEGIEIPYAQRDITIRNAGELGKAFRPDGQES